MSYRLISYVVLGFTLAGCKDKPASPDRQPVRRSDARDAGTASKVTPTANYLPAELDGVTIGMNVPELRAVRAGKKLEAHAFHDSMIPDLKATDPDDVFFDKLDRATAAAGVVHGPDWPGTEGLYTLEEGLESPPYTSVRYSFHDNVLYRVIVYLDSHESALAVAKGLLGTDAPTPATPWKTAEGQRPGLKAWVYNDRYVLRTDPPADSETGSASER